MAIDLRRGLCDCAADGAWLLAGEEVMAKFESTLGDQPCPWRDDMAEKQALAQLGLGEIPPAPPKRASRPSAAKGRAMTWQARAVATTIAKGRKHEG